MISKGATRESQNHNQKLTLNIMELIKKSKKSQKLFKLNLIVILKLILDIMVKFQEIQGSIRCRRRSHRPQIEISLNILELKMKSEKGLKNFKGVLQKFCRMGPKVFIFVKTPFEKIGEALP